MKGHFKRATRRSVSSQPGSQCSTPASVVETPVSTVSASTPGGFLSPQAIVEPQWDRLYAENSVRHRITVVAFKRIWDAAVREDETRLAVSLGEETMLQVFQSLFLARSSVSREEFEVRAPGLWRCRSDLAALPAQIRDVDPEIINRLFPQQARPVPKRMLLALYEKFRSTGGAASQFLKLYVSVAREYRCDGAPNADVLEAFDVVVLAGCANGQIEEGVFSRRFNVVWQRQGELASLTRMVRAASALLEPVSPLSSPDIVPVDEPAASSKAAEDAIKRLEERKAKLAEEVAEEEIKRLEQRRAKLAEEAAEEEIKRLEQQKAKLAEEAAQEEIKRLEQRKAKLAEEAAEEEAKHKAKEDADRQKAASPRAGGVARALHRRSEVALRRARSASTSNLEVPVVPPQASRLPRTSLVESRSPRTSVVEGASPRPAAPASPRSVPPASPRSVPPVSPSRLPRTSLVESRSPRTSVAEGVSPRAAPPVSPRPVPPVPLSEKAKVPMQHRDSLVDRVRSSLSAGGEAVGEAVGGLAGDIAGGVASFLQMAGEVEFEVGQRVRRLEPAAFPSGKTLEVGDLGTVTRVPGAKPGMVAEVRFDAVRGQSTILQDVPAGKVARVEASPEAVADAEAPKAGGRVRSSVKRFETEGPGFGRARRRASSAPKPSKKEVGHRQASQEPRLVGGAKEEVGHRQASRDPRLVGGAKEELGHRQASREPRLVGGGKGGAETSSADEPPEQRARPKMKSRKASSSGSSEDYPTAPRAKPRSRGQPKKAQPEESSSSEDGGPAPWRAKSKAKAKRTPAKKGRAKADSDSSSSDDYKRKRAKEKQMPKVNSDSSSSEDYKRKRAKEKPMSKVNSDSSSSEDYKRKRAKEKSRSKARGKASRRDKDENAEDEEDDDDDRPNPPDPWASGSEDSLPGRTTQRAPYAIARQFTREKGSHVNDKKREDRLKEKQGRGVARSGSGDSLPSDGGISPKELKAVEADELPEDTGAWGQSTATQLRFTQWPGTTNWADSLDFDDNPGRATAMNMRQLAANHPGGGALSKEEAQERRLVALMQGPFGNNRPLESGLADSAAPSGALRDLPYSDEQISLAPAALPSMVVPSVRAAAAGLEDHDDWGGTGAGRLDKDPQVFQELLCITEEPPLHWVADEMMATLLPPGIQALDPSSRDPLVLEALQRCAPDVPPILWVDMSNGIRPEVLLRHPYQEVFEQIVALASLLPRSAEPLVLIEAAQEASTQEYSAAVTAWREDRSVEGPMSFVNSETGERKLTDPRQHLLRELQLTCRIMAMLRTRVKQQVVGGYGRFG